MSCKNKSQEQFNCKTIYYDTKLSLGGLSIDFVSFISKLEPYGAGNPRPTFLIQDTKVVDVKVIKEKHIMLILADEETTKTAFSFNSVGNDFGNYLLSAKGKIINILATADISEYQHQPSVSIKIMDVISG